MSKSSFHFEKSVAGIGRFQLRSLKIPDDIPLLHSWVSQEYARFWGMQDHTPLQVEQDYRDILKTAEVYLGLCNGRPAFLMETYAPELDPVGEHYSVELGDRGMHVLVAPPLERPVRNFTWMVFTVVMDALFSDPGVKRVVVEPDMRNDKIHTLNRRAGFVYRRIVQLPSKTACLAFCTRQQYRAALAREQQLERMSMSIAPQRVVDHLKTERWAQVNGLFIRKAIAEFSHELLISPQRLSLDGEWGRYVLNTDQAETQYHFRARLLKLEHWFIDADSLEKQVAGRLEPLDALSFIIEISASLDMNQAMLPTYLEEISSTLYSGAYKHARPGLRVNELLHADFQTVEYAMMEGHPVFVANNGRIGFDALDYHNYAPEAGSPIRLIWLAVDKSNTVFACTDDLSYADLLQQELGEHVLQSFSSTLVDQGLNPSQYLYMPVHPWQWFNKLASIFSPDIAAKKLICLGYGDDDYLAQQSIRTFFNYTAPHKRYVKTALSILNMGFMRGLSPYYMSNTPAINDWICRLIDQDPYLADTGFTILREVAAVGYRNTYFEQAISKDSPYKKMLSALWRESPIPKLMHGQRLMTMASLLHIDIEDNALLPALIRSSGLDINNWLRQYLKCYLGPLLHCFYAHDLVFMPHGENLILVLEKHVPVRAIMKDIAEESAVMNTGVVLSEKVRRLAVNVPEELKVLSIFTDMFDCIFRFMAAILLEHADYPEHQFWRQVAECVQSYQAEHPELSEKFQRHDLFAEEFTRSCLNRLQLNNNQQMIDLADPAKNLQFVGKLKNPLAEFREEPVLANTANATL